MVAKLFYAITLLILGNGPLASFSRPQATSVPSSPPVFYLGPTTGYSAALPNANDVLRFRRGERYNIPDPSVPELGEGSEPGILSLPFTHTVKDATPFGASDAVLAGSVTAGQAYLSDDKRNVYSEFKFSVQDVIKNSQSPNIQVGQSIDVQRQGGVIRLPSGKTITRGAVDKSMPRVGGRYLLFLKYDQNTEDYSILMGYQLDGNSVYRLDDLKASDSTDPQVGHLLRSEGITESQFLTRVQASRDCQSG